MGAHITKCRERLSKQGVKGKSEGSQTRRIFKEWEATINARVSYISFGMHRELEQSVLVVFKHDGRAYAVAEIRKHAHGR